MALNVKPVQSATRIVHSEQTCILSTLAPVQNEVVSIVRLEDVSIT